MGFGCIEQLEINRFGSDDFSLICLLRAKHKGEGLVFVEDGDFAFGIFQDGHLGIPNGISWAVDLDLIDRTMMLESQVFGQDASALRHKIRSNWSASPNGRWASTGVRGGMAKRRL